MKELLAGYVKYDHWANEMLLTVVLQLTKEQQQMELTSSFPSVQKTCAHMWDAYRIWWQRLQKQQVVQGPTVDLDIPVKEIVGNIFVQNLLWQQWLDNTPQTELESLFAYTNMKGEKFEQPLEQVVLHLCNHGTYHRGQLVTMLRQIGVTAIPQTDYIVYGRLGLTGVK